MKKARPEIEPYLLIIDEVAALTGISRTTLYKMVRNGLFPRGRVLTRGRVAWLRADVQAWCDALPIHSENYVRPLPRRKATSESTDAQVS